MFNGAKRKGAKARVKKHKVSENIVREEKGRNTISDDDLKILFGIDDSLVKRVRDVINKPRKQPSIDGSNESRIMAASRVKTVNASGNEEEEENARSAAIGGSDEDTEDQICGTCKVTVDGDCLFCEVCNKWYHKEC